MQPAIRITLSDVSPVPGYNIEPFESGVLRTVAGLTATDWSNEYLIDISDIGERVDISQGGNYVQLGDCTVTLSNHGQWLSTLENDGATMIGAKIECGFRESIVTDRAEWTGIISDVMMEGATVVIRAENILAERHKAIPARTITKEEFPTITSDADGSPVPILYGAVEELVPPSVLSEKNYLTALAYISESGEILKSITSIVSATLDTFIVDDIRSTLYPPGLPSSMWWYNFASGENVYIEITSGTGSGQTRAVKEILDINIPEMIQAAIFSPWDIVPDSTSSARFYSQNSGAVLVIGDEATPKAITVEGSITSNIAFSAGAIGSTSDIVSADVSADFLFGENYKNLYYSALNTFANPELSDGITAMGTGEPLDVLICRDMWDTTKSTLRSVGDTACLGRLDVKDIPDNALSTGADLYAIVSLNLTEETRSLDHVVIFVDAVNYDGTSETVLRKFVVPKAGLEYSSYSSSILPDGTAGNFSAYALSIPDPTKSLMAYSHLLIGAAYFPGGANNSTMNLYTRVHVAAYEGEYIIQVENSSSPPIVGDRIRPYILASEVGASQRENRLTYGDIIYGDPSDWRTITNVETVGGTYSVKITLDTPFATTVADIGIITARENADNFITITGNEIGIAFSFGEIAQDSTFLASTSAGRTYSALWPTLPSGKSIGDPITLARDMALDILYRDLGLTASQVNFDSFQFLQEDTVTAAIVDKQDSASVLADLCAEFNWVISHDEYGRETAHNLFFYVGSPSFDVTIDTGHIVEGSFTGRDITDVQDLCTQPSFAWDWTQNKGYRQSSNVLDISVDPATLTADNYQRYIVGFGDYATSLDIYQRLYAAYQLSRYRRSQEYEYKYIGSSISSMLSPLAGISRFEWIASRKFVFRFEVAEGSASAPKRPGLRIKIRHKRYTQGVWVYGTCIESTLSTSDAVYKITMMVDPGDLTPGGAELYVD